LTVAYSEALAAAIFLAAYGAIVFRNVSRLQLPIWLILVSGAAAMVATGTISVPGAYAAVNLPVITFLFSMFVIVTALDISGALDSFAGYILRRAKGPVGAFTLSFTGFAFASAFLMNDTIALMGTPIVITIARKLHVPAKPMLLGLAFAVTIGSVTTPMGNPQNLLIALASGVSAPVFTFARFLLLPTLANLAITLLLLRFIFRKELRREEPPPANMVGSVPRDKRLAHISTWVAVLTTLLILFVNVLQSAGVSQPFGISEVSFFGASLLLLASGRAREIIQSMDWGILLLFAGLFVMMQSLSDNGIISVIASYLPSLSLSAPAPAIASIIASGVLLSQVVSNVPMVALYLPILTSLGYTPADGYAWAALAGGSTIAGNLTILGAASNLIIIEEAERHGEKLSFGEFLRVGLPVTALNVLVLYLFLLFGL
jgi:Na+/H+ antiporter NhaD/arsenite permease-like protein